MKFNKIKSSIAAAAFLVTGMVQATTYDVTTSKRVQKSELSDAVTQVRYFEQTDRVHAFVAIRDFDKNTWPKVVTAKWYSCGKLRSQRDFKPDNVESHLKRGLHHVWFWVDAAPLGVGEDRVDIYADGIQVATTNFYVLDSQGAKRMCDGTVVDDGSNTSSNNPKGEQFLLNTDALFKFNGSKPNEIYNSGLQEIGNLITKIQSSYKSVDKVTVVGHTDYLGTDGYNYVLSQARAETVRDLLVQRGIPNDRISIIAKGETVPVKNCSEGSNLNALKECLAPNRRVEVFVSGVKR